MNVKTDALLAAPIQQPKVDVDDSEDPFGLWAESSEWAQN